MTAPLSGIEFAQPKTKGMMGGPRTPKGNDGTGDMTAISGATRGQDQATWMWLEYPYVTGGLTSYDPQATMTGSNLSAVDPQVSDLVRRSGVDQTPTGYSQGGIAGY
jgi:hypothetical protein